MNLYYMFVFILLLISLSHINDIIDYRQAI